MIFSLCHVLIYKSVFDFLIIRTEVFVIFLNIGKDILFEANESSKNIIDSENNHALISNKSI